MRSIALTAVLALSGCGGAGIAGFLLPLEQGIRGGPTALEQGYQNVCEVAFEGEWTASPANCTRGPVDAIIGLF